MVQQEDAQLYNLSLENKCNIVKRYFSEKNKLLIQNKVESLLKEDDFINRLVDSTFPASVDLIQHEATGRTSQVQTEPADIVQLSSLQGQPPPTSSRAFNKSEFETLYDKKVNERSYIQGNVCRDICFDRLEDYMMSEYNAFIETQFFDPVKRQLIFNSERKPNDIINYLDCKVITDVLKESKLALQEHYHYMRDLNIKTRKMKEPINTRDLKVAIILEPRKEIDPIITRTLNN